MSIRTVLLTAGLLLCSIRHDAQTADTTGLSDLFVPEAPAERVYEMFDIEKPPVFPGGEQALMKFIAENLQFPAFDKTTTPPGKVVLSFVIDKNGKVCDVKMLKGFNAEFDAITLGLIRSMPDWKPGTVKGEPVAVLYTLPIRINWQ
jgi:protein TonB